MALAFVLVIFDVCAACAQTFDIRACDMRGHHDVIRALQHQQRTADRVEIGTELRGSRKPFRVMPFESVRYATERDGIGHWIDHHARADEVV